MRQVLLSSTLLLVSAAAGGHTLAGDEGALSQLGHQLSSAHHLPLTVLLLAGCILLLRHTCRSPRSGEKRMR